MAMKLKIGQTTVISKKSPKLNLENDAGVGEMKTLPNTLYHGTSSVFAHGIIKSGLKPKANKYLVKYITDKAARKRRCLGLHKLQETFRQANQ